MLFIKRRCDWSVVFPSPYGELHFSIEHCFKRNADTDCFRPLTGNYISQSVKGRYGNIENGFRPLTGNYISQSPVRLPRWYNTPFPSPYGELHFSIFDAVFYDQSTDLVSVPLRGITFLNRRSGTVDDIPVMFPSPYGELHFSIFLEFTQDGNPVESFRPLTGNYISQSRPWNPCN